MSTVQRRNNVRLAGNGPATMVFAHGFGCDQTMWRFLAPAYEDRFRTIAFDLVGSGGSDLTAYERSKYASLHGYADDLLEIVDSCATGPVVYVGHSVSAMIGLLAANREPQRFSAQVMLGPSPCFINDGDYVGGFNRDEIDVFLEKMEDNFLAWSEQVAPMIMGAPNRPDLRAELTESFRRNDPAIARHFARTTFLADHRADLEKSTVPALILQCSDDLIVPREVGAYMLRHLPGSTLRTIDNVGHCPHLSAPGASVRAIEEFLEKTLKAEIPLG
jgi:sigma-B regulation protein RsbQ